MGKIIKDLVEDTFVKKNTNIYELSILMGVDSFDFMVLDSRQHLQALRSYAVGPQLMAQPDVLRSLVQNDSLLGQAYRTVRVGWVNSKNTLVPQRLYNEQKKAAYLEQVTAIDSGEAALTDTLSGDGLRNIYILPRDMEGLIRQTFSGSRLFHVTSALLEGLRKLPTPGEGKRVYAHLRDRIAFIFAFDGKGLLLANAYPYQSAKDLVYFLLLPYQQFGFKPDTVPAYLSGQLVEDSEIYRAVFRYIRNIHFVEPPAFFHLGSKVSQEPGHFYFDLLGLSLCG